MKARPCELIVLSHNDLSVEVSLFLLPHRALKSPQMKILPSSWYLKMCNFNWLKKLKGAVTP